MVIFVFVIAIWLMFAWLATIVGDRDRFGLNAILGLLLGPIGVLVAAVLNRDSGHSADGGGVTYDLAAWAPQGQLGEILRARSIPHQWAGGVLTVPPACEAQVDGLIDDLDSA